MGEITSCVGDEELIEHMREVILPYVREVQMVEEVDKLTSYFTDATASPQQFVTNFASKVQAVMDGLTTQQVCIYLILTRIIYL